LQKLVTWFEIWSLEVGNFWGYFAVCGLISLHFSLGGGRGS
jgi:hypothetical protein